MHYFRLLSKILGYVRTSTLTAITNIQTNECRIPSNMLNGVSYGYKLCSQTLNYLFRNKYKLALLSYDHQNLYHLLGEMAHSMEPEYYIV